MSRSRAGGAAAALCAVFAWSALTAADAQTAAIVLRWKAVPGAARYQLQIAPDEQLSSPVVEQDVPTAFFRWNELPTRRYFWRVRSVDAEGRIGRWSATEVIAPAVEPPKLASPADNAVIPLVAEGRGPYLRVEPSRVLKQYVFQLAPAGADFQSPLFEKRGTATSVELPLLDPGQYQWRARGVDLEDRASEFSEPRTVQLVLAPPVRQSPASPASVEWAQPPPHVELRWAAHPAAKSFTVEISREGAAHTTARAQSRSFTFSPDRPGVYRWRVRAEAAGGAASEFSDGGELHVGVAGPTLAAPPSPHTLRTRKREASVVLSWSPVAGAAGYDVELTAEGMPSTVVGTETAQAEVKLAPGRYQWRVTARLGDARSTPSEARSIEVEALSPLPPPVIASPVAGARVPRRGNAEWVRVAWLPVADAATYEVSLNGGSAIATETLEAEVPAGEGAHVVRVRALDSEGVASDWSEPHAFRFQPPLPARAEVAVESVRRTFDGSETVLTVRLLDGEGAHLPGLPLSVEASIGTATVVAIEEAFYRVRHRAGFSEDGIAKLRIRHGAFEATEPFTIAPPPLRFGAGARIGLHNNLGVVSAVQLQLEGTFRTALLGDRVLAAVRIGFFGASAPMPDVIREIFPTARATVIPIAGLAVYEHPLGRFSVHGGAGAMVSVTTLEVGPAADTAVVPGALVVAGGGYRLWRGRVLAELAFGTGGYQSNFARLTVGGGTFSVGYRLEL